MPQFFLRKANKVVNASPLSGAAGGEGYLCKLPNDSKRSLKIYNRPSKTLDEQLEHQIANPPATILNQLAWPLDIVEDGTGNAVGYVQQHFSRYVSLIDIISPTTRPRWASPSVLKQCAYEVAHLLAELHAHYYLFPDLHPDQFLIAPRASIVLIDVGSCQFKTTDGFYPCTCARPEYQQPEFFGCGNWADVAHQRDEYSDTWSLNVLIFYLSMGCHPFDGKYLGSGTPLPPPERAKNGLFPFDRACKDYQPPTHAPMYRTVHEELRDLFHRCFVDGHRQEDRARRPLPAEWADTLRGCAVLRNDSAVTQVPGWFPTANWPFVSGHLMSYLQRLAASMLPIAGVRLNILCLSALVAIVIVQIRLDSHPKSHSWDEWKRTRIDVPYYHHRVEHHSADPSIDDILRRIRRHNQFQKEPLR